MASCGKKGGDGNENLWHGYKIYDGSTLDLDANGIEYTLEFFPESGTYVRTITQLGETSEISGTYIENEDGTIYMYSKNGSPWGIFTVDGDEATVSGITSLYMEYFTQD
jgi:hypothetical protein